MTFSENVIGKLQNISVEKLRITFFSQLMRDRDH